MPTWIVHGFRWPRRAIRIHIILQNLEDCAPGYIMAPDTIAELQAHFETLYPDQMKHLPNLRFLEQYDPDDETTCDQPYAYVCEQAHEIKLGVDLDEYKGSGIPRETWNALLSLRNEIAPGEKIGWYVVVNGDVERWVPPADDDDEEAEGALFSPIGTESSQATLTDIQEYRARLEGIDGDAKKTGFKKWLGKVKKARSVRDLRSDLALRPISNDYQAPTSPRRQ
ncbi:hypothetical protein DM02DRAFT_568293 [Periconia macrospinosa]|uniref:Uncharacterized protein n=1 Tax=Periconia macrospinosa TaxID=97972 RepID=A0A2V1DGB0_9PLEO|nr:hypothetical protein DM02DRAFT_568293 [Periconia macrospinosa]